MKKKLFIAIKLLISSGILYYLIRQIDFHDFAYNLSRINILILLIPIIVMLCQVVLSALKWKCILSGDQIYVPLFFLFKSYLLGNFISLFLPSSFGGDIYRVYALKKYNPDFFQNASSVLFDRLSGLFALCSISIISYALFFKSSINYKFMAIYLVGVFLFFFMSSGRFLSFFSGTTVKLFSSLLKILKSFNQYRTKKAVLIQSLVISFLFQSNIVVINKVYCIALNIDISLQYLFMIIPLIYLTEVLPISINGLGLREGAFVFFFSQAGCTNEQALGLALLVITMRYMFSMVFGGPLLLNMMILSRSAK